MMPPRQIQGRGALETQSSPVPPRSSVSATRLGVHLSVITLQDSRRFGNRRSRCRLLWLRKLTLWERKNTQPSQCLAALMGHFEWESEPPITAEGGLGCSAPALLRLLSLDLEFSLILCALSPKTVAQEETSNRHQC